jgi:hypothetical protein
MKPKIFLFLFLFLFSLYFSFVETVSKKNPGKSYAIFKRNTRTKDKIFPNFRFSTALNSEASDEPIFFSKAWSNSTFEIPRDPEKEARIKDVISITKFYPLIFV